MLATPQGQKETGEVRLEVRVGDLRVELGPLGTMRTPAGARALGGSNHEHRESP